MNHTTITLHSHRNWIAYYTVRLLGLAMIVFALLILFGLAITQQSGVDSMPLIGIVGLLFVCGILLAGGLSIITGKSPVLTLSDGLLVMSKAHSFTKPSVMRVDDIVRVQPINVSYLAGRSYISYYVLRLTDKNGKLFSLDLRTFPLDQRLKLLPFLQQLIDNPAVEKITNSSYSLERVMRVWYGKADVLKLPTESSDSAKEPAVQVAPLWVGILVMLVAFGIILAVSLAFTSFMRIAVPVVGLLLLGSVLFIQWRVYRHTSHK